MKKNIYKYLAGNDYPGRGIVLGKSPDGQKAFVAYWIMGRSANSRNRVFEPIDGGIRTVAADPAKLEDPHLIIYNAVLTLRETTVVTNGDQTDTIARFMNGNLFPGYSFEAALATRTYEDDAPNFTPRIADAGNLCCAPKIPQRFTEIYKTCASDRKSCVNAKACLPPPEADTPSSQCF